MRATWRYLSVRDVVSKPWGNRPHQAESMFWYVAPVAYSSPPYQGTTVRALLEPVDLAQTVHLCLLS